MIYILHGGNALREILKPLNIMQLQFKFELILTSNTVKQ